MSVTIEAVKLLKPEPGEVLIVRLAEDFDVDSAVNVLQSIKLAFPDTPTICVPETVDVDTHGLEHTITWLEGLRGG